MMGILKHGYSGGEIMAYPKQLITSLCEQLPESLTRFFELEKRKYFQDYEDINDMVSSTLWDFIKDETSKTEINAVNIIQVKMRRQKKNRWMEAYQKAMTNPLTNPKNPFYPIADAFQTMPGHAFMKLYDANDVDTVIENQKKAINVWKENDKSLLIDFPLITSKTKTQVLSSFKVDLILVLIGIIMDSFDGNIESYFAKKPAILLNNPMFSPTKYSVPSKQQTINSYVADLVNYDKDDMVFQMLVNYDPSNTNEMHSLKVFDSKDNQILLTLFNNIRLDFYQSKQLVISVGDIAKSINTRPNKHLYEDVKLRVHNMARTGFRLCKKDKPNDPVFTFSMFDSVETIEQDGKEFLVITFGNTLYESITKKRMISVTSSNYNSLERELSKLLYHHLQKERISLSTSSVPNENGLLYKTYDYSYFQRIILFKRKKKKDNIQLITETLTEFVEKAIALADFRYEPVSGLFHLYYFPLSEDEKSDLISMNEVHEDDSFLLADSLTDENA